MQVCRVFWQTCMADILQLIVNPLTPTVAIWESILCQTGLSRHL